MKATVKISVRNNQQMDDLYSDIKSAIKNVDLFIEEYHEIKEELYEYESSLLREKGWGTVDEEFDKYTTQNGGRDKYFNEEGFLTEEGMVVHSEILSKNDRIFDEIKATERHIELSKRLADISRQREECYNFLNFAQGYLFEYEYRLQKYQSYKKAWFAVCKFWGPDFD